MLLLITSAAARFLEWAAEHSWDRWMGYIFVPLTPALTLVSVSRSAAVLGSSNVSTPKTQELSVISPALKPAAPEDGPEDGRTPLNRYSPSARGRIVRGLLAITTTTELASLMRPEGALRFLASWRATLPCERRFRRFCACA